MAKVERYVHTSLGINGRFDTIQAAVLLEKLKIFDDEVKKRREIGAYYSELLKNLRRDAAGCCA